MKTKIGYLNFILTVCAIALTAIVLQNADIIPKAHAYSSFNSLPLNEKGELPVKIMNSDMEVYVTNRVGVRVEDWDGGEIEVNCNNCR